MPSSCPGCGAAVEFAPRTVHAVHGTCAACGGTFTVLESGSGMSPPGVPIEAGVPESPPAADIGGSASGRGAGAPPGPPCAQCGTPLALRSWTADLARAVCPDCGATIEYRTMSLPRAPRGRPGGGFEARGSPRDLSAPRSRPCRECGGPLTFSTDASGVVTGSCASCGNRFTLPPRSDRDRRGPPGRTGGFSRGYAPRFQRPKGRYGDSGDRPPRRGPPRRTFGRRSEDDDDEDTGFRERRRRRPREE